MGGCVLRKQPVGYVTHAFTGVERRCVGPDRGPPPGGSDDPSEWWSGSQQAGLRPVGVRRVAGPPGCSGPNQVHPERSRTVGFVAGWPVRCGPSAGLQRGAKHRPGGPGGCLRTDRRQPRVDGACSPGTRSPDSVSWIHLPLDWPDRCDGWVPSQEDRHPREVDSAHRAGPHLRPGDRGLRAWVLLQLGDLMSGYKVLREMTYGGVQYAPGDVISQDAIESAAPGKEKEGKLLRTRFIASDSFERDPQM